MHMRPIGRSRDVRSVTIQLLSALVLVAMTTATTGVTASASTKASSAEAPGAALLTAQVAPNSPITVSQMPAQYQTEWTGFQYFSKLLADPYSTYKPPPPGQWSFCYSTTYLGNTFQEGVAAELTKLSNEYQKAGLANRPIKIVNANNDAVLQLSQMNALITGGCKVIFSFPASPTSFCPVINRANAAGDLFISVESPVYCPNAMNSTWNGYQVSYIGMAAVAKAIGGKGNVVIGEGIPGVAINTSEVAAVKNVLAGYPKIKVLGYVAGEWTASIALTAMTSFLSTHPETVNGVYDAGDEDVAFEQALLDAGRPVAKINSITGECGILAFWKKYPQAMTVGLNQSPNAAAYEAFLVAERMLSGQKPIVNDIFYPVPEITASTFNNFYKPTMTVDSTCIPPSPGGRATPDSYFNGLFTGPYSPKLAATP